MLRIMTLNLNYYQNGHGEWDKRKRIITQTIQTCQPHIIAFQAVRQEPDIYMGLDQATQLSHELPDYPYITFQAARVYNDGSMDGSAFLSRFRILETDYQPLTFIPELDDPNHRIILHGLFDLPECPLHLFNAHFSWVSEQAEKNIEEALAYAGCFKGYKALLGDLNTKAGSDLLSTFSLQGWHDAWKFTHPEENGLTFDSQDPTIRIDYVWVDSELKDRLVRLEIIANQPMEDGIFASDHFGLMASFEEW